MRFSFLQGFNQGLTGILNAQSKTFSTQAQIASGKRVLTAADDPVAAARIIQLDQQQSQINQYINNADSVDNRLSLEESQLAGVTDLLNVIHTKTLQVANGTNSDSERKIIAVELEGRLTELLDLANTRATNGEYIFAGFQGGAQPFVEDNSGGINYVGDDGQRFVNIASSTTVPANDSGEDIFVNIAGVQEMFFTDEVISNTGSASISFGEVIDQDAFANSDPEGYTITYDAAGPTYNVAGQSDGTITAVPATSNGVVELFGWSVTIDETPADGDSFILDSSSSSKQDMMSTIAKLIEGLNSLSTTSDEDDDAYKLLMSESLQNIESAQENIAQINAKIGARFNTIQSVREVNEGIELVNASILAEIEDLDYAEAVSRLTIQSFTLEAAQQSYAKVNSITLFNFL